MADNILPSLPSEHFPTGVGTISVQLSPATDGSASRWLELDLQRLHLSHRRSRACRATTNGES